MYLNPANSFNEIYTAYYRKSYLYVKSYIHDDMAAEDIVSDALIKLWKRMKREMVDPIRPFLFAILKNQSLDYLKHQTIKRGVHDAVHDALKRELEIRTTNLEASDPNDIFSTKIQQIIETTLNSLPVRTKGNIHHEPLWEQTAQRNCSTLSCFRQGGGLSHHAIG